jgi:predicted NAD-dependent protein-ADP-ribosyltransferase YbiA (DUF1768 family)
MDIKSGRGYPAGALSNFAPHPFVLDGVNISSMEGFLQSLKFKNPEMQEHICTLVGVKAKMSGKGKNWQTKQTLFWQGTPIKRESDEYQTLLDRAYESMFTQNVKAKKALLATGSANLTHNIGWHKINDTVLTKKEFCSRLMRLRSELRASEFLTF